MPISSAFEVRNQVGNLQFRPFEATRIRVLREHAAGHVECNHYLHSALLNYLNVTAPLRPRKRQNDQCYRYEP